MQISKKILQAGAHLALFLAVSVAAVSSAQAGADFGIEEDSNAAPVAPAKPKLTSEQFQAIKTLKDLGFVWEVYFSDILEAQKAGIEFQSQDELSAYGRIKELLGFQSLTKEQFKAGLVIKNHFSGFQIFAQMAYFGDVLEAQEAGIEIRNKKDLSAFQQIKGWLEGEKITREHFQARSDLQKLFEECRTPTEEERMGKVVYMFPGKDNFLNFLEAQKARIQIQNWEDLETYEKSKELLEKEHKWAVTLEKPAGE